MTIICLTKNDISFCGLGFEIEKTNYRSRIFVGGSRRSQLAACSTVAAIRSSDSLFWPLLLRLIAKKERWPGGAPSTCVRFTVETCCCKHMYVCMYVCMYIYIYMNTYNYNYNNNYIHAYIHIYTYIYIYRERELYTQTHTHSYIHRCI